MGKAFDESTWHIPAGDGDSISAEKIVYQPLHKYLENSRKIAADVKALC